MISIPDLKDRFHEYLAPKKSAKKNYHRGFLSCVLVKLAHGPPRPAPGL